MKFLLASSFAAFADKIDQIPELDLGKRHVLCIVTAAMAEDSRDWLEAELDAIRKKAKKFSIYDLRGKTKDDLREDFSAYDVFYVAGGNTYFLLEHIKKSGFSKVVAEELSGGKIYLGGSAGAIVPCPRIDYIGDIDDPEKADLEDYSGMNFLDFLILPHADHPYYRGAIEKIEKELSARQEKYVSLADHQAIWIDGDFQKIF